jgi:hypothetical protein
MTEQRWERYNEEDSDRNEKAEFESMQPVGGRSQPVFYLFMVDSNQDSDDPDNYENQTPDCFFEILEKD